MREVWKMVYCTKCGTENGDIAVYCSECGQKLQKISYDEMETQKTSHGERETLQEMIHVAWMKGGLVQPRKVLYFTDRSIYIAEGTFLVGMGFGLGGLIGHAIEKKELSEKEKESRRINFQELAAKDPMVVVIPYNEIISLVMPKKRMLLNPTITIETTNRDYKCVVMQGNKYKQYIKTIPAILGLGDKVNVG